MIYIFCLGSTGFLKIPACYLASQGKGLHVRSISQEILNGNLKTHQSRFGGQQSALENGAWSWRSPVFCNNWRTSDLKNIFSKAEMSLDVQDCPLHQPAWKLRKHSALKRAQCLQGCSGLAGWQGRHLLQLLLNEASGKSWGFFLPLPPTCTFLHANRHSDSTSLIKYPSYWPIQIPNQHNQDLASLSCCISSQSGLINCVWQSEVSKETLHFLLNQMMLLKMLMLLRIQTRQDNSFLSTDHNVFTS